MKHLNSTLKVNYYNYHKNKSLKFGTWDVAIKRLATLCKMDKVKSFGIQDGRQEMAVMGRKLKTETENG